MRVLLCLGVGSQKKLRVRKCRLFEVAMLFFGWKKICRSEKMALKTGEAGLGKNNERRYVFF